MINLPTPPPDPEVDFVHLAKTIWRRKLLVVKLTAIAALAGFLISIMIPNRYTASTTLVQEIANPEIRINDEKLLAISALAEVAGIDLARLKNSRISNQAYSNIFSSVPFRQELMRTRLNFVQRDSAITLYDYYTKPGPGYSLVRSVIDIPGRIMKVLYKGIRSQNRPPSDPKLPTQLTQEEQEVNKILGSLLSIQLLDDEYIIIRCTLPGAYAAAQLTQSTEQLLQKYLTEIQTEKALANLRFVQERHDEAKMNFLKIQEEHSTLQTGKEQTVTLVFKSASEKASAHRIAENVYLELAKQLEQSKIALNEQTPIFKVINPVNVPVDHTYPNRAKIVALFTFFGFALGIVLILARGFFEDTITKWNR